MLDTNPESQPGCQMEWYRRELARTPLLSHEETCTLAWRYINDGDLDARDHLIRANMRLVVSLAR